jgi:oligoribonuclease (3'-5' exoribonuclease)
MENLFWVDTETSGLDPMKNLLLEISVVITPQPSVNPDMPSLWAYNSVVRYEELDVVFKTMSDEALALHMENNLMDSVLKKKGKSLYDIDQDICMGLQTNFGPKEKFIAAGKQVHFDISFLNGKHTFYKTLSKLVREGQRTYDVNTLIMQRPELYEQFKSTRLKPNHRSADDVDFAIDFARLFNRRQS